MSDVINQWFFLKNDIYFYLWTYNAEEIVPQTSSEVSRSVRDESNALGWSGVDIGVSGRYIIWSVALFYKENVEQNDWNALHALSQ